MDKLLVELSEAISEDLAKGRSGECAIEETRGGNKKAENVDAHFNPLVLKRTVYHKVSAVIINDGRILMIKEAKKKCRGLWYLPSGKVEANESLVEAVKREVLEESGLSFDPTSLICVDWSFLSWYRFTFTGRITGGKLKTIRDKDKESMEAGWYTAEEVFSRLQLRKRDICPLIDSTLKWREMKEKDPNFISMPVAVPHSRITVRVVLILNNESGMKVLLDKENCMGFLQCTPSHRSSHVHEVVEYIIKRAQTCYKADHKIHGIITVEHVGKPHAVADGICITLLAEKPSAAPVANRYTWWPVSDETIRYKIGQLLESGCVQIIKK